MAPRWTYIEPNIVFNPLVSFQVVIMALLGGAGTALWPAGRRRSAGLLIEVITANFPNHLSIVLGVVFIIIVYFLPSGVVGLIDRWRKGGLRLGASAAFRAEPVPGAAILETRPSAKGVRRTGRGRRHQPHRQRRAKSSA